MGPGAPKGAGSQGEDRLPKRSLDLRRRTVNTENTQMGPPGPGTAPKLHVGWIHLLCWASQVALSVKNPPASAGASRGAGLVPGLGRSPKG